MIGASAHPPSWTTSPSMLLLLLGTIFKSTLAQDALKNTFVWLYDFYVPLIYYELTYCNSRQAPQKHQLPR